MCASPNCYGPYDFETYGGARQEDYRTAFQVDRDRIIYFPAFRRLQAKTQVFLPGEYDFYRTRLTHSIEVAQIGRSITGYLRAQDRRLRSGGGADPDLIEAVCLAHDLGHPPFGHIGERELNRLLQPWGGFEGNAQTLRLLTETAYERETSNRGMKPTRALLDGVMKYKRLHGELPEDRRDHHFLYDEQEPVRRFTHAGAEPAMAPADPFPKSLECQIMDWADDTAYSLHDIVDGVRAGFISIESLRRWQDSVQLETDQLEWFEKLITHISDGDLEVAVATKVGRFVQACSLEESSGPLSNLTVRHAWRLLVREDVQRECRLYKQIAVDLIFRSHRIQEIEFKGRLILRSLFEAFSETAMSSTQSKALAILPPTVKRRVEESSDERGRMRAVADHLASMTDGHALRTYKRLFDPDFRSLTEIT
jgi:dGTPase